MCARHKRQAATSPYPHSSKRISMASVDRNRTASAGTQKFLQTLQPANNNIITNNALNNQQFNQHLPSVFRHIGYTQPPQQIHPGSVAKPSPSLQVMRNAQLSSPAVCYRRITLVCCRPLAKRISMALIQSMAMTCQHQMTTSSAIKTTCMDWMPSKLLTHPLTVHGMYQTVG